WHSGITSERKRSWRGDWALGGRRDGRIVGMLQGPLRGRYAGENKSNMLLVGGDRRLFGVDDDNDDDFRLGRHGATFCGGGGCENPVRVVIISSEAASRGANPFRAVVSGTCQSRQPGEESLEPVSTPGFSIPFRCD